MEAAARLGLLLEDVDVKSLDAFCQSLQGGPKFPYLKEWLLEVATALLDPHDQDLAQAALAPDGGSEYRFYADPIAAAAGRQRRQSIGLEDSGGWRGGASAAVSLVMGVGGGVGGAGHPAVRRGRRGSLGSQGSQSSVIAAAALAAVSGGTLGGTSSTSAHGKGGSLVGASQERRFAYFRSTLGRLQIWQDRDGEMFNDLKQIVRGFMGNVGTWCAERFRQLAAQPRGMLLTELSAGNFSNSFLGGIGGNPAPGGEQRIQKLSDRGGEVAKLLISSGDMPSPVPTPLRWRLTAPAAVALERTLSSSAASITTNTSPAAAASGGELPRSSALVRFAGQSEGSGSSRAGSTAGSWRLRSSLFNRTETLLGRTMNQEARQDRPEVGAIRICEADRAEAQLQCGMAEEEVFLSQLHLRSRLLNDEFQRRVQEIVARHAAAPIATTCSDMDNGGASTVNTTCEPTPSPPPPPPPPKLTKSEASTTVVAGLPKDTTASEVLAVSGAWRDHSAGDFGGESGAGGSGDALDGRTVAGNPPASPEPAELPQPNVLRRNSMACSIASNQLSMELPDRRTRSTLELARGCEARGSETRGSDVGRESGGASAPALECWFNGGGAYVRVYPAAPKGIARMREKLRKYAPPHPRGVWPLCANILDPIRASVVVSGGADSILEVLRWFTDFEQENGLPVRRVKNKFSRPEQEIADGYRDVQLSVIFTGSTGLSIIGEIQIHDLELYRLKMKMHKLYKVQRAGSLEFI